MNTLIETSIQIYGIGHPNTITVFNMLSEEDRTKPLFRNLEVLQGRKLTVWFDYRDENDVLVKENCVKMTIPKGSEEEIKSFILLELLKALN